MKRLIVLALALTAAAALTGCSTLRNKDTEANMELFKKVCSADEGLAAAKAAGAPVTEDLRCTANKDAMEEFYAKTRQGRPAKLLTAEYYTLDRERVAPELYEEEKDRYPMLFFTLVEYFGKGHLGDKYRVRVRLSTEPELDYEGTYEYLMHYEDEAPTTGAAFEYSDRYVLVNDDTLTWEQIERGMLSSHFGDAVASHTVFTDLVGEGGSAENEEPYEHESWEALVDLNCPADEGLKLAKELGATVVENLRCTANKAAILEFYERAQNGEPARALIADHYTAEKESLIPEACAAERENLPTLIFTLLEYLGPDSADGPYRVTVRQSAGDEAEWCGYYPYLLHFIGNTQPFYSSLYIPAERFVLAENDKLTWEQIERSIATSSSVEPNIGFYPVFTDYGTLLEGE